MAVHLWKSVAGVGVDLVEAEVVLERILHPKCELTHHLVPETNKYGCIIRKRSEK